MALMRLYDVVCEPRGCVRAACCSSLFPTPGWVRDAQLPTSRTSDAIHASNANIQKLEIPRNIFLPQCRTTACTGKGNPCPGDPKYQGKCKEKETCNALYMPCLVKPWVSHTSSYEVFTSLWAVKIFPKPVNFHPPAALGGRVGWQGAAGC